MNIFSSIIVILISVSIASGQDHWEKIAQPTDKLLRNVFFVDSQTGWCAGADGIILHTTDGVIATGSG